MKTLKKLALVSMLALSSPAWSIPLATVGGIDDLIAQTTLSNSGDGNENGELSWVEMVLGIEINGSLYSHTSTSASDWTAVDNDPGAFALALDGPADWFVIRIGANSGATSTHFLFDNLTSLNWAVIDLVEMGFSEKNTLNIGKISHISTGPNVPTTNVPEPGVLALMGLGLLGFGLMRRRKAQ